MKNSEIHTKINAGKYKGKKIQIPPFGATRSTKSILKDSIFDTIQFEIIDSVFVEVFGGSGSVGLEALSRGAKSAYFIEKDNFAYNILKNNCKNIDEKACKIYHGDSFDIFKSVLGKINGEAYFYFDPPFEYREGMDNIYEKVYDLIKSIPPEKTRSIIIEHMSLLKTPEKIGIYQKTKTKKFGKSSLAYYS